MSKHVLDIVYTQAICWLALFYAPLISIVTVVKCLLIYALRIFFVLYVSEAWFQIVLHYKTGVGIVQTEGKTRPEGHIRLEGQIRPKGQTRPEGQTRPTVFYHTTL